MGFRGPAYVPDRVGPKILQLNDVHQFLSLTLHIYPLTRVFTSSRNHIAHRQSGAAECAGLAAVRPARSRREVVPGLQLPLPEDLYEVLRASAAAARRPITAVARDAIREWLEERRQYTISREIAAYAAEAAGTPNDLDPALERVGIETLRKTARRRK